MEHADTELLNRWMAGDADAATSAMRRVYTEMRRVAGRLARDERPDHTLRPTALVHETYIELSSGRSLRWQSRRHFLNTAARIMRHVLVDHGRRRRAAKRGGDKTRVLLEDVADLADARPDEVLAVDAALADLERLDPDAARLVEARYFAGLSLDEVAECLGVSRKTVVRRWRRVRAWLRLQLRPAKSPVGSD